MTKAVVLDDLIALRKRIRELEAKLSEVYEISRIARSRTNQDGADRLAALDRINNLCAPTAARTDFGPLEDGYQYYWSKHGALSAWELRVLADELDKRNALWDARVQKTLAGTVVDREGEHE